MGQLTTNFNFKLPYESEYYSIDTVNENTAAIDDAIIKNARREYLIAAANSSERDKKRADVVCTANDCFAKVSALIESARNGDTLYFCAGTYNFYADTVAGLVIDKKLNIVGSGINSTVLRQQGLANDSTRGAAIFTISGDNVVIENMMLYDYESALNTTALVDIGADSAELRSVFFIQNIETNYISYCVRNTADCSYIRIENCRIYRVHSSPTRPMFFFKNYAFDGVIGSLISSGTDGLVIGFKNDASKNATVIYGCKDITYV